MSKFIFSGWMLLCGFIPLCAQDHFNESDLVRKLDSLQKENSISKHFAKLYLKTTKNAIDFFSNESEPAKNFIRRLELRFAGYFFEAVNDYSNNGKVNTHWQHYFSDTGFSPLQYQLIGANAHINGDIWKAMVNEFTLQEIQVNKSHYFRYNAGLRLIYDDVYASARRSKFLVRLIDKLSFGISKWYGNLMLRRWRKRQVKLAVLYFTHPKKFERKLLKLKKKMKRLDHMIVQTL